MAKLGILVDAQVDFITGALANKFAQAKVPVRPMMTLPQLLKSESWLE